MINQSGTVVERNDYYPYGMQMAHNQLTNSASGSDNKRKFSGKELDVMGGLNLYDSQARWYDPCIPVLPTVDPLAEKYYSISPYVYCKDNPLRLIDPDGRDPGDAFKSPRAAAKDFAMLYNDNSIKDKKEYGAMIYKIESSKSETYYSYTVPNVGGSEDGVVPAPDLSIEDAEIVSSVHTHSNYDKKYDNDKFSKADKDAAKLFGKDAFLSTPKGELLEYNVKIEQTVIVDKGIPSDKAHPDRSNKIDSDKLPKDEPVRNIGRMIFDNIIYPILKGASSIKN